MFDFSIAQLLSRIVILVVAFTIHELSHAVVADRLGDDTARLAGRITLNPLKHLDPLGSLLLLVAGFGWAKPTPVNPYKLGRNPAAGMMLVSAAGPFSNLMLAVAASIPFQLGLIAVSFDSGLLPTLSGFLIEFIFINLLLFFFNLIPLAPLDGEKILFYFLPAGGREAMRRIQPYSQYLLLLIIFIGPYVGLPIFNWLVGWPTQQLLRMLIL
ncbi:MAG: site-2 protease family protein [Anaerolineales bacterium]|nr:site-2 protease family protein [Anaerolineales bacterium]